MSLTLSKRDREIIGHVYEVLEIELPEKMDELTLADATAILVDYKRERGKAVAATTSTRPATAPQGGIGS